MPPSNAFFYLEDRQLPPNLHHPSQGHPDMTTPLWPKPYGANSPPRYYRVLVQCRGRWWEKWASCCTVSCLLPQPHLHPRTHHLLRAVTTLLVSPVQRELFVVHCVAGVEGAGQAGIRAIEHIEGSRYCDFHVPPWWHCGQSHKLVSILANRTRERQACHTW